jgi:hypothetical protein
MNILQTTFILALVCQKCLAENPVGQLERQVMHLEPLFNDTLMALPSKVANLNSALENALNKTGKISFLNQCRNFCTFTNIYVF